MSQFGKVPFARMPVAQAKGAAQALSDWQGMIVLGRVLTLFPYRIVL